MKGSLQKVDALNFIDNFSKSVKSLRYHSTDMMGLSARLKLTQCIDTRLKGAPKEYTFWINIITRNMLGDVGSRLQIKDR